MNFLAGDRLKSWNNFTPCPFQVLDTGVHQPAVGILRLDLLHSWASGNKYYKLKYSIEYALQHGFDRIVSKGGAFSNHLAALAEACHVFDIKLVAIIRSYTPDETSPTISRLRELGTEIIFVNPDEFKLFHDDLAKQLYPGSLFIPEGGLTQLGIQGAAEITNEILLHHPTHIIIPGGTMGTACGIISTAPESVKVIIVPAWKGCNVSYVSEILERFKIEYKCSWSIWPDNHFGGFGKFNPALISFMTTFTSNTGIVLDPVYTGKMMFAVQERLHQGYFDHHDHVIAIHTGGLQGLAGYKYRFPEEWGNYNS